MENKGLIIGNKSKGKLSTFPTSSDSHPCVCQYLEKLRTAEAVT